MGTTGRFVRLEEENGTARLTPVPVVVASLNRGRQFAAPNDVFLGPGRRAGWMDVASHREAHHCRLHAAKFLDGDRQGLEEGLGVAAAGALPGSPCGCIDPDPDR